VYDQTSLASIIVHFLHHTAVTPHNKPPIIPPELGWKALLPLDGAALEKQYSDALEKLALKPGMLGVIFKGARCDIHNPALLKQLIVNLIDKED